MIRSFNILFLDKGIFTPSLFLKLGINANTKKRAEGLLSKLKVFDTVVVLIKF